MNFLKEAGARLAERGLPDQVVPSVTTYPPFAYDEDKRISENKECQRKKGNPVPQGRDGGLLKGIINNEPVPDASAHAQAAFGAKRGAGATSAQKSNGLPFATGGPLNVQHPEASRYQHARCGKYKQGYKFAAAVEKEIATAPDADAVRQIIVENKHLKEHNSKAVIDGHGDILGNDGLAIEHKDFREVEKVGDAHYEAKTYRRNHRKHVAISAYSNNRSKNMRRVLVHRDNPAALLFGQNAEV